MKLSFSDGYELLPAECGYPTGIAYDGIRLALEFYEEGEGVDSKSKKWFRITFKPIWFAVSHSSFEDTPKAYVDIDPLDALGLFPAVDHAQFKGLDLRGYRFNHYDEMIRVITFYEPRVQEIPETVRLEKVEKK